MTSGIFNPEVLFPVFIFQWFTPLLSHCKYQLAQHIDFAYYLHRVLKLEKPWQKIPRVCQNCYSSIYPMDIHQNSCLSYKRRRRECYTTLLQGSRRNIRFKLKQAPIAWANCQNIQSRLLMTLWDCKT